jgi:hypothetical protein
LSTLSHQETFQIVAATHGRAGPKELAEKGSHSEPVEEPLIFPSESVLSNKKLEVPRQARDDRFFKKELFSASS